MEIFNQFGRLIGSVIKTSIWVFIFILFFTIYFAVSNFLELVIFGSTCLGFYILYKGSNLYFSYLKKKYNL